MNCCDLSPGDLDRKVSIYQDVRTPNGSGGYTTARQFVLDVWAKLTPVHGNERIIAGNLAAVGMVRMQCRYTARITEQMTAVYGGRELNIRSIVNVDERNEWLEIMLEKGVAL